MVSISELFDNAPSAEVYYANVFAAETLSLINSIMKHNPISDDEVRTEWKRSVSFSALIQYCPKCAAETYIVEINKKTDDLRMNCLMCGYNRPAVKSL